jgi:uncharacterized protein YbjT (DUF2867 family)
LSRIVIVGGAGQTGRSVLRALRDRGAHVTAVVRSEGRRRVAIEAGASAGVLGDLQDRASLHAAFAHADVVLMIPPVLHPREDELVAGAVAAAAAAGAGRFVLHSVLHPYTPAMPHHVRKATAEVAVRESGLRWTILQPAMYAQTVLLYRAKTDGSEFRVPWDVARRFSVVDLRDVAEAAAIVVLGQGHDFASYELAGPEALSMQAMAAQFGLAVGRPCTAVSEVPERFQAPAAWPPSALADARAMFAEYGKHGLLGNPGVLRGLLGRAPTRFIDVMRREAAPY